MQKKNNVTNDNFIVEKCQKLTIKTQNKIEIIFKIHFSFSSIISINDIEEFFYSSSADDEKTMTNYKIIKIVYKVNLNKTLKIYKIINKALQRFVNVIIK